MTQWAVVAGMLCVWLIGDLTKTVGADDTLFSTGFEAEEGYSQEVNLSDQKGWVGSGADGIVSGFLGGNDQQAYIGFQRPIGTTNDFYYVYKPVNRAPIPAAQPIVNFSVFMQIVDSTSTNGPWDDFRWSIYNTNGIRLFSVDFDNAALAISYLLDDGVFVSTDTKFDTHGYYELVISMNFARNLWNATLNDEVIVHAKPITTTGSVLNFGDADAVWSLKNPSAPGNNFMVFDDYTVTAGSSNSIPARLVDLGAPRAGAYHARLYGEPGLVYRVEASSDLRQWQPLLTFTAPVNGVLEFQDPLVSTVARRFYRAVQVTP